MNYDHKEQDGWKAVGITMTNDEKKEAIKRVEADLACLDSFSRGFQYLMENQTNPDVRAYLVITFRIAANIRGNDNE